jgi:CRISPR-associated endonuclease/helicase Cas3
MSFDAFFKKATHYDPFPFQKRFAETDEIPNFVNVPTGLGKTAMAIVGWLWRRFEAPEPLRKATPRRLVYTLPMRVLVEQTRDNAIRWLQSLNLLGGHVQWDKEDRVASYEPSSELPGKVAVYVLMGGEEQYDWEIFPEREALLIGTQDMLLSRALNRGYAASRSRWPMQFGLLHTDALWVFDEVQLMGEGLATSAQLEAFRYMCGLGRPDGLGTRSVWMSATLQKEWLQTVDFRGRIETLSCLSLDECDKEKAAKRWNASKKLQQTAARQGDYQTLAEEIQNHHRPGTLTLVVVNTVERARKLYDQLRSKPPSKKKKNEGLPPSQNPAPDLVLLHSRFRPFERAKQIEKALQSPREAGTIVISTQVVEAGVDISATNLFTEVAPWPSLIQRFGRCNRKGENENASLWWIPLPEQPKETNAIPYRLDDLTSAAKQLESLNGKEISLQSLERHCRAMPPDTWRTLFPYTPLHVIRRKDLIELFDTTPDLAGNDLDIDRFIRGAEESDLHVFWRVFDQESEPGPDIAPKPEELCPVPAYAFRDFLKSRSTIRAWRWNFLNERWEAVTPQQVVPGQIILLHGCDGGYTPERGWDPKSRSPVPLVSIEITPATLDATDADPLITIGAWKTMAEHSDDVVAQITDILSELSAVDAEHRVLLETAARWHDRGKAHPTFQAALPDGAPADGHLWAKAQGKLKKYAELGRPHFRHELASALAVLMSPHTLIPPEWRDLVAYLVAAHHGKVRLSIRSLPGEKQPDSPADGPSRELRYARGIWEGDALPETDLGGGITAPAVTLSLEPMELGLCERPPFEGQPSWAERMIRLRNRLGPFHLAFLEAIVRAADWRASRMAGKGSVP